MKFGINRYIGNWTSSDGLCLHINKVTATHASVSLFKADGTPICRPYWDGRPMIDMQADYDDYTGEFVVHLWEPDREYYLHLDYRLSNRNIDLDKEVLSPSVSQYENDTFLDQFLPLFGILEDYKKTKTQNNH